MTHLRKIMLEELQRRNYSDGTIRRYLHMVEEFASHFGKSPDKLGLDHLRTYQAYLLKQRKLAVGSVVNHVAALRFLFVRTLKRQEAAEKAFLRYYGTWRGLAGITTPTLLTNGGLDRGVPPLNARRIHAKIPGSSLSIYAGATHGMLFQDAGRFAAQIAKFSARARAAAAAD